MDVIDRIALSYPQVQFIEEIDTVIMVGIHLRNNVGNTLTTG